MIAALPTIAEQVRNAAACAARTRADSCRAQIGASGSARVQHANALRHALLQLMARNHDLTTRELYIQASAAMATTEGSVHHIVYDLRDRGWAASHVPPNRIGIRIGTGRVNRWRITPLGRTALTELADRQLASSPIPTTTGDH